MVLNFRTRHAKWSVQIPRQEVLKLKPGQLTAFQLTLNEDHQKRYGYPKFIVFQARVTPTFEIEQTGSGIPCSTEEKVKEIKELIEAKNDPSPTVTLVSWAGGFTLGAMSHRDMTWDERVLFPLPKHERHDGNACGYSIQEFEHSLDNPPKLINEKMLPTIDLEEAKILFANHCKEIRRQKEKPKSKPEPSISELGSAALKESQFQVLSKSYPETVKLLKTAKSKDARAVYESYQRESFALTGKMAGALTFTEEQFMATAKAMANKKRRKNRGTDPIDFELVAGWFMQGYSEMTPDQRYAALRNKGLNPASPEAIRKACTRLKLPPKRKPGVH